MAWLLNRTTVAYRPSRQIRWAARCAIDHHRYQTPIFTLNKVIGRGQNTAYLIWHNWNVNCLSNGNPLIDTGCHQSSGFASRWYRPIFIKYIMQNFGWPNRRKQPIQYRVDPALIRKIVISSLSSSFECISMMNITRRGFQSHFIFRFFNLRFCQIIFFKFYSRISRNNWICEQNTTMLTKTEIKFMNK